jgi:hypothetical protein
MTRVKKGQRRNDESKKGGLAMTFLVAGAPEGTPLQTDGLPRLLRQPRNDEGKKGCHAMMFLAIGD